MFQLLWKKELTMEELKSWLLKNDYIFRPLEQQTEEGSRKKGILIETKSNKRSKQRLKIVTKSFHTEYRGYDNRELFVYE